MRAETAQAHHIFADRAVAHIGLLEEILLKADDIEVVALLFTMQIATEAAKRHPVLLFLLPGGLVKQRVERSDRYLVHNFAAMNQRNAIQQLVTMRTMRL